MKHSLLCLFTLFITINTSGQIIDQIKDASDRHSAESSSSSSSDSDDSYYDDSNDDTYYYNDFGYSYDAFSYIDPWSWVEKKRADTNYKFSALNLLYRQTTSSGQVSTIVPEVQIKLGAFYSAIRVNTMLEEGASREDKFQTVDIQFFGFQTNPNGFAVLNMSAGIVGEQYSGKTFAEGVIGLRFQPTSRFSVAWEGRLAGDELVRMRTESNFIAGFAVFQNNDISVEASAFGMSALYYQEVRVNGFGFGVGLRF